MPGASIAIDDCYELWESGFVSIPYNFELRDLQPQLQKLLQGPTSETQERGVSKAQPALYLDLEAAEPSPNVHDLGHSGHYLDDMPARDSSASAIRVATITAEALARVSTKPSFSSSSLAECSESTQPGNWPLRMAAVVPQANTSVQNRILCRPGTVSKRCEPMLVQARRWRGGDKRYQRMACQNQAKARCAALK